MITCHLYRDGKLEDGHLDPETIKDHLQHDGPKILLDIEDPTQEDLDLLERQFGFHPLTMEDTEERGQRPKLEIFDRYSFLVAHAFRLEGRTNLRRQRGPHPVREGVHGDPAVRAGVRSRPP